MTVAEVTGEFEGVVEMDEQAEEAGEFVDPVDPDGLLLLLIVVVYVGDPGVTVAELLPEFVTVIDPERLKEGDPELV